MSRSFIKSDERYLFQVPPHYMTEASIVIDEVNYKGNYTVVSKLSGSVVVSIRRFVG